MAVRFNVRHEHRSDKSCSCLQEVDFQTGFDSQLTERVRALISLAADSDTTYTTTTPKATHHNKTHQPCTHFPTPRIAYLVSATHAYTHHATIVHKSTPLLSHIHTYTHTCRYTPLPPTHSPQALGCDVAVHAVQLFRRKTQRTKDMLARAWSDRARREHSERDRLLHQQLRPSNALLQEAMKYLKEYRWVAWVC